jgi:hypothetical protein
MNSLYSLLFSVLLYRSIRQLADYVSCGSMNDAGHKLLLSAVLFGHFSDSSASTIADAHYKELYMNFVERPGDRLFQDLKSRIFEYIGFFYLTDKRRTDAIVSFY